MLALITPKMTRAQVDSCVSLQESNTAQANSKPTSSHADQRRSPLLAVFKELHYM